MLYKPNPSSKHIFLLFTLVISVFLCIGIVSAIPSTDRTQYYNNGTTYLTDSIEIPAKTINGNYPTNGSDISNGGWSKVTGSFVYDNTLRVGEYSNNTIKVSGTDGDEYAIYIKNSTFNGSFGIQLCDSLIDTSPGVHLIYVYDTLDSLKLLFGVRTVSSNTFYSYNLDGGTWGVSAVPRTLGCHNFTVEVLPTDKSKYNLTIDNTTIGLSTITSGLGKIVIHSGPRILHWSDFWVASTNKRPLASSSAGTATFVSPTPNNGDHNNIPANINVTCSSGGVTLYADNNRTDPITKRINNLTSPANWTTDTAVDSSIWYYKASCDSGATNTTTQIYYYDVHLPLLSIQSNNFFNTNNLTTVNIFDYSINFTENVTMNDSFGLFAFERNISYEINGTQVNDTTLNITGTTVYNFTNILNTRLLQPGYWYNVDLWVSDIHTAQEIRDYSVTYVQPSFGGDLGRLIFPPELEGYKPIEEQTPTAEINYFTEYEHNIDLVGSSGTITTEKDFDRYSFTTNFEGDYPPVYTIDLTTDAELTYLPDSKMPGHFIVSNDKAKEGNWIDFNCSVPFDDIQFIEDNHYQLLWSSPREDIVCHSIGGLNIVHQTYRFYFPLHKLTANILNETNGNNPVSILSTLKGYVNGQTELSTPSICYNAIENGSTIVDNQCISITPNISYNYYTSSGLLLNGTAFNQIAFYGNCPTCSGGQAQTTGSGPFWNSNQLQVYNFGIDNCSNSFGVPSNGTALIVNFFNYQNRSVNVSYQSNTIFFNSSFSMSNPSLSTNRFCIYPSTAILPQQTQFLYTDSNNVQYSYFYSLNFTNNTQTLNLFTNNGTSQVLFTIVDLDGNALANYKLQILQYNVGTGSYTTTETLNTDSAGHAIGNIILNTAYYNFLIYDSNNNLVSTKTGIRVTTTTYLITIGGITDLYYTDLQNSLGVVTSVSFNNNTNNFVFTWSDPTGNMHLACLRVINTTYLGSTTMTDTCQQSTAGTLLYNINPQNETQYLATGYLKYDYEFPVGHAGFRLPNLRELFNVDLFGGLFAGTLLLIVGMLIALPNPVLGIIYFMLVFVVDVTLGLFKFIDTSTTTGIGVMSSMVLLGLIVIYIGGKQQ